MFIEKLENGSHRAVVGDFGVAQLGEGALGVRGFATSRTIGVTIEYAPPELIQMYRRSLETKPSKSIFRRIDCHSFAVTVYELLCRKRAWRGYKSLEEIEKAVLSGKRPNTEFITSEMYGSRREALVRILTKSWAVDAVSRPEMARIRMKLYSMLYTGSSSSDFSKVTPTPQ